MLSAILMICLGTFVGEDVDSLIKKADVEYQAQRWQTAAELYEKAVEKDPKRSRAWFRLGIARHGGRQAGRTSRYDRTVRRTDRHGA